jgi:hypothetical protein
MLDRPAEQLTGDIGIWVNGEEEPVGVTGAQSSSR